MNVTIAPDDKHCLFCDRKLSLRPRLGVDGIVVAVVVVKTILGVSSTGQAP